MCNTHNCCCCKKGIRVKDLTILLTSIQCRVVRMMVVLMVVKMMMVMMMVMMMMVRMMVGGQWLGLLTAPDNTGMSESQPTLKP